MGKRNSNIVFFMDISISIIPFKVKKLKVFLAAHIQTPNVITENIFDLIALKMY
jgi:hypothetical protein